MIIAKLSKRHLFIAACLLISFNASALPKVGAPLPAIELSGDLGGLVSGKPWKSSSLTGKVHMIFHVDPDERDKNEELKAALKKANFPAAHYQSTVVINMDATSIPNFILSGLIDSSQEENPQAIYVKDIESSLVTKWGMPDDAYNLLVLDRSGKLLLAKSGQLTPEETSLVVKTVEEAIASK